MYIMGINGNLGRMSHDPAVVLVKNGEIIFAAEEERYINNKHACGKLPIRAMGKALEYENISIFDIDYVAIPQDSWGELFDIRVKNSFHHWFGFCPKIKYFNHHLCHAASTYFSINDNEKYIVYSIDGSGDSIALSAYLFQGNAYREIKKSIFPNSFGLYYSIITQYLGFEKNNEEYKVMSLAALGEKRYNMEEIIKFKNGELELNKDFLNPIVLKMGYPFYMTEQEPFYSKDKLNKICNRRIPGDKILKEHMDLAKSLQTHFEELNVQIIKELIEEYKCENIAVSGGSMLNCKFIGKLLEDIRPNKFFISSFPDDAGNAVGAALLLSRQKGFKSYRLKNSFLGDCFGDDEIEKYLKSFKLGYNRISDRYEMLVEDLLKGKIVANFNGRMEFGPRALGNRSILANIDIKGIKEKLNRLKQRYSFQPFAIAILDEKIEDYFCNFGYKSPFMNIAFKAKKEKRDFLKEIIHNDDTIRIQSVNTDNMEMKKILDLLYLKSNIPMVINTSFNMKGSSIVRTPKDAIATFYSSEIDVLYLGDFRLEKDK